MVDGKPVTLENLSSNRTLDVSVNVNGVVTHVQEILDTDPGNIINVMNRSSAGGWSWRQAETTTPRHSLALRRGVILAETHI